MTKASLMRSAAMAVIGAGLCAGSAFAQGTSGASADRIEPKGSGNGTLSDKLEKNDGVITPKDNAAPDMRVKPPVSEPGTMPVIKPPGSPGGNPDVTPK